MNHDKHPDTAKRHHAPTGKPDETELTLSRVIDAPRERVWAAFADGKTIGTWWGPNGFTTTTHERHFAVGGMWRYTMHGPDGTDYPNRVIYEELVAPERMVYRHDADADKDPDHFRTTITLEDVAGKTRVTLTMQCTSAAMRKHIEQNGAIEGGNQTLARLDAFIAKH